MCERDRHEQQSSARRVRNRDADNNRRAFAVVPCVPLTSDREMFAKYGSGSGIYGTEIGGDNRGCQRLERDISIPERQLSISVT